jgi:hypothetical protein
MVHPLPALGPRAADLLAVLTRRVRLLSVAQVARVWWATVRDARRSADAQVAVWADAGWLVAERLLARPELALRRPLVCWQPGQALPDFARVAAVLRVRWHRAPAVLTPCVRASATAHVALTGRPARSSRPGEVTHDLHVARVYLLMRASLPTRARSWVLEDALPTSDEPGEKRPDACVTDGRHQTAIELAGEYDAPKLRAFHDGCAAQNLAYELW